MLFFMLIVDIVCTIATLALACTLFWCRGPFLIIVVSGCSCYLGYHLYHMWKITFQYIRKEREIDDMIDDTMSQNDVSL